MLAIDVSGSMGEMLFSRTNAGIAATLSQAIRMVIEERPEFTFDVCLFANYAVLAKSPAIEDIITASHSTGRGRDNMQLAMQRLRYTPEYIHAYKNRNAILGIALTDACFRPQTIKSARKQIRESASREKWMAILAHGASKQDAATIFGTETVDATADLTQSIQSIAMAIQSTIERAELVRS